MVPTSSERSLTCWYKMEPLIVAHTTFVLSITEKLCEKQRDTFDRKLFSSIYLPVFSFPREEV